MASHPVPPDRTRQHSQSHSPHDANGRSGSTTPKGHGRNHRARGNGNGGGAGGGGGGAVDDGDNGGDDGKNGTDDGNNDASSYDGKDDGCADPRWASPYCGSFHYHLSRRQTLRDCNALPYESGSTWPMWTVHLHDPASLLTPSTGSVRLWHAHHLTCGTVLCHPVAHIMQYPLLLVNAMIKWGVFDTPAPDFW